MLVGPSPSKAWAEVEAALRLSMEQAGAAEVHRRTTELEAVERQPPRETVEGALRQRTLAEAVAQRRRMELEAVEQRRTTGSEAEVPLPQMEPEEAEEEPTSKAEEEPLLCSEGVEAPSRSWVQAAEPRVPTKSSASNRR